MMKRKVTKLVALSLAMVMTVALQTDDVYAKNYYVEDYSTMGNIEINLNDSVKPIAEPKIDEDEILVKKNANKIKKMTMKGVSEGETEQETGTPSTIYYGSVSGHLSQANDYLLYPTKLSAGEYLQVRLQLPKNAQIDYDLLLYNSSLSLIKTSDYVTCVSDDGTLDESLGYLAGTDETVYVCVYSAAGGSKTEAYTLDYSITTNFADSAEPDENAKEAKELTFTKTGAGITAKINSPIDNDWYKFTVEDSPAYDKIRLSIPSSSATNGCNIEIYRNIVSNYYGMQYLGSGIAGEIELPAGIYYLRVVSTNTFNDFNSADIPTYHLSVSPVSRVDRIGITTLSSPHGARDIDYPEGCYYRVEEAFSSEITVAGVAYYKGEDGELHPAVNAYITGEILDEQWQKTDRPDMERVYSSAVTDEYGWYYMKFQLNPALGRLRYSAPISAHRYDFMDVEIKSAEDESITASTHFYYLHSSMLFLK